MAKVIVVATSKFTRGGITAVIRTQQKGEQWKKFNCVWIGYHIDRAAWFKILYFIQALLHFIFIIPFYQIVHLQFSLQSDAKRAYCFFKISRFFHKKTIVHLHCGDQIDEIWSSMYQELFTMSDLAIVLSPSIKRKVQKYIGNNHRIEVLYNACPTIHQVTPFEKREKEILFAGTLNSNKGYIDLIRGFAKISSKYPDWKIVFAGNGEIDKAKNEAQTLGIDSQCEFLGWIDGTQKEIAFRRASIFCLASYAEGFPMAVLDAWAYGVPVVSTPAGGLADIIKENINGLLFSAGNPTVLADKLDKMISDKELRRTIAINSKELANRLFDVNVLNHQLENLYNSLEDGCR